MKNLVSFSDYNLNESVLSDLYNSVKRLFGGQKSKLDSLASEYEEEEMSYAKEWNDIVTDIDELQLKETEPDLTPGEKRAYTRQISNKEKLLKTLEVKRDREINFINKKAQEIAGSDPKISAYWEVKKAGIESKIAKKLFDYGKKVSSKTYTQGLKSRYENAARNARSAERTFKNYFSQIDTDGKKSSEKTVKEEDIKTRELIDMRLSDFPDAIKKFPQSKIREILRDLKKERNETLLASDLERDEIYKKSQKISDNKKAKEFTEEEFRKITKKYRDKISDLRSKITIAQRYD
jgi:hypothetical protein